MASNDRQQRRKRIMEKGNDRLALITGQIKTVDESTTPTPTTVSHHSHTESSPPIMLSPHFLNSINADTIEGDENVASSKMVKMRTISESPATRNLNLGNQIQVPDISDKIIMRPPSARPSINNNPLRIFSSRRINHNIICSERTRAICSLIIALLVIAMNSDRFITSRPFYIIVLTDVTVVVARLFGDTKSSSNEVEDKRTSGGDNVDDAFKLLERGLLFYQAIRALFVDCSIYLVVVIFGLSIF